MSVLPQFRQRFASATSTGISPIEFSKKLLNIWDGRSVEVFVDDDGNEEELKHAADNNGKSNELGNFIYM